MDKERVRVEEIKMIKLKKILEEDLVDQAFLDAKPVDEDKDIGHQDDEPNMLKSTALEIMEYGKKLMDKLDKYDDMEGEVDFPNWWQAKLTVSKEYLQKAYHYLDSEEKVDGELDEKFNIRKSSCKQSDGDSGTHTLSYRTKKGKKMRACHTSKKQAQDQVKAIKGPRR